MRKVIKKFPKTELTTCLYQPHKNGCYLSLVEGEDIEYSMDDLSIVVDFDKNDNIIGIEFIDGLPKKKFKKKRELTPQEAYELIRNPKLLKKMKSIKP